MANKLLGQFNLAGIRPAARGTPQIEVTFDIDANGILHVSAKDKGTGKEQKITIQSSGGLSDNEIKEMVKDAEKNLTLDEEKKKLVEMKNNADSLIHSSEKSLKELGAKIDNTDKNLISEAIESLKKDVNGNDYNVIKNKIEQLSQLITKISN